MLRSTAAVDVASVLGLVGMSASYGRGQTVVRDVDLEVHAGEVVGLLGANGAGKTTVLRAISGVVETTGKVLLDGQRLSGAPESRARRGVAHVPEGRQLFGSMSVTDNLLLGANVLRRRDRSPAQLESVLELFPELGKLMKRDAAWLSGGEQQMVAIGRALMAKPRLVLLDEPTMGLAPIVIDRLGTAIRAMSQQGLAVLVAEENLGFAGAVTERAYVLRAGQIAWRGPTETVLKDPELKHLFLG
jgi:branched-chain amino acid transport system ATP-binding protein